jgi:hypothetical protein
MGQQAAHVSDALIGFETALCAFEEAARLVNSDLLMAQETYGAVGIEAAGDAAMLKEHAKFQGARQSTLQHLAALERLTSEI